MPLHRTGRWGDRNAEAVSKAIDAAKLREAVDAAFGDAKALTAAFLVIWRGNIIAERYAPGITARTPLESWEYDPSLGYPDHLYLYTGPVNSFHYAATRPLQWPPNTVGRYRNTDPVLVNYLIRLGVEARNVDYLAFPQRALLDRIGVRTMVIETDADGDMLTQGYDLASARLGRGRSPHLWWLLLDQRR